MSLSFFVSSDLYCAGYTEDGDQFAAERYYVVAETSNGTRFKHVKQFNSTEAEFDEDEEGFGHTVFPDLREEAVAKANDLLSKIEAHTKSGGKLDPGLWYEIDPRYGSESYQGMNDQESATFFQVRTREF